MSTIKKKKKNLSNNYYVIYKVNDGNKTNHQQLCGYEKQYYGILSHNNTFYFLMTRYYV